MCYGKLIEGARPSKKGRGWKVVYVRLDGEVAPIFKSGDHPYTKNAWMKSQIAGNGI